MHWKKGTVNICAISLATAIMVNTTKMESMKFYPDVIYYTSPGPIFYVDSEYEVRNQIFQKWHAPCLQQ